MPLIGGGDNMTFIEAVTAVFGWIPDAMAIFTTAPAIYFVAVALVGAVAGVSRKFVPMRKR